MGQTRTPKNQLDSALATLTGLHPSWNGLITQAFPVDIMAADQTPVGGTLSVDKFWLDAGVTITNLCCQVTTGGTLTSGQNFAALFDMSGNRLALTGDQSATWNTGGFKNMPLTSTYTPTTSGFVFMALLANGSSLTNLFRRAGSAASFNANLTASVSRSATTGSGLTAMPASFVPTNLVQTNNFIWMGAS